MCSCVDLINLIFYQRPALHAYFSITVPLAKITSDQIHIDHRTNAESSETVKHSNLKLTFTVRAKGSKWLSEAAKRNNAIDYVD